MAKKIGDVKFELTQVYKTYAEQLQLAANVSDFLLDSSNINSAGQQVEGSLRVLLKKLLPDRVSVTQGHIVDKKANVSYQQDVLIAESFYTKSLISSLDGTEFYPIEAIFACGEVKKTWSQTKLKSALKSIKRNKEGLEKTKIPADHIQTGSNFIKLSDKISANPYRNPLFSFTFSIDFDKKYNENKVAEIYNEVANKPFLPNISVILNRGIIVCVDKANLNNGNIEIKLYPEFNGDDSKCSWVMLRLKPEENFAYLIFMLTQHINDTILEKVSAMEYGSSMIEISKSNIFPIK